MERESKKMSWAEEWRRDIQEIRKLSFSKEVLEQAKKYGIGIIKQVGKSMEIEAEKLKAY